MSRHIIHVHTSAIVGGGAKLPTPDQIEYGEIAINYSKGNESISIKNVEDEIVTTNLNRGVGMSDPNSPSGTGEIFNSYDGSGCNSAFGAYSHAEGYETTASGDFSHAEGRQTIAIGATSHAEGKSTKALGLRSHAEGCNTQANGDYSHAEGYFTSANGNYSHAEGHYTVAKGNYSHAEGFYSEANGNHSHAEGYKTSTNGGQSHAEGCLTNANGMYSHAEGYCTSANGDSSHAEGERTNANGTHSHAEGWTTSAIGNYSHAEGSKTIAGGTFSHSEGLRSSALGEVSHAEGRDTIASGNSTHAEGQNTVAIENYSHAEGFKTLAVGQYSHAEGAGAVTLDPSFYDASNEEILAEWNRLWVTPTEYETGDAFSMAKGRGSHVEGKNNLALGDYSHAEGYRNVASGECSHAEGYRTTTKGNYSHAEGSYSIASGECSHAEGYKASANGDRSHAEGNWTVANGLYSHAEGDTTKANGVTSHAEGRYTKANGDRSHAEGDNSIASGDYSHAQNKYTTASADCETSMGRFNKTNSTSAYNITNIALSIGNGTSTTIRGNAFEVLFNGSVKGDMSYSTPAADYAEMFEWEDGNPDNEDRVGYFVVLHSGKIQKATPNDKLIIGIVSSMPGVIGNNPMRWNNKYANDEWGRPIYEEVEVPYTEMVEQEDGTMKEETVYQTEVHRKLNPEWRGEESYTDRTERKEWAAVGLLGQILVRQDGTLVEDDMCNTNAEGIATKSDQGFYVIKVINDSQALVLFK